MVNSSPADKHAGLSRIRILREFFAHKHIRYLNDITPGLLDEFRVEVLADRKPKTVKNYIALLRTALNKAVEWELIDLNPIANVKLPKIIKTFHFYSQNEVEILIKEAFEPLKTGIILLVYTGMRRGELYHLRVRDVDLKAKSIRVWPYEGYSPKGKRPRTIPAATEIVEILQQLIHGKSPDDYMFRPYKCQHQLYKRFREFSQKLGIKGNLHNLRHTFASRLAMSGTPIPVIKDFLGHSDISTTMIYSHLSPNLYQTEIGKLQFKLK
ncbi:MAG: site-specific integrase [candidate division Zixibacteria bacterium]|nr:site-specific integrase [candidate division Zixibacteria bacterium]